MGFNKTIAYILLVLLVASVFAAAVRADENEREDGGDAVQEDSRGNVTEDHHYVDMSNDFGDQEDTEGHDNSSVQILSTVSNNGNTQSSTQQQSNANELQSLRNEISSLESDLSNSELKLRSYEAQQQQMELLQQKLALLEKQIELERNATNERNAKAQNIGNVTPEGNSITAAEISALEGIAPLDNGNNQTAVEVPPKSELKNLPFIARILMWLGIIR
jgi:predicted RNase H-like nuclease (RuvC/YqgF family)